uniref:Isoform D of Protein bunched, class 1/class 3/D/E isoforms n=1 Tax=Drosophila melanogaster TaxID=7227 RepID=Q24522-3|nr:bunched, isoform D [Drosophila melanogaster]NP_723755.2 bunched, isoform H [Drosophila melanogaster]AAF53200.3 bunched, isoform H [Drosophila melanogaster]ACZ94250.1 bunched, isoform D [Drosophila melanogaster]|eukprot:NP_001162964.1 bunched, isoform D [Drosophila melanogaster]
MIKYPRTTSSTSSGYFDDDEAMMNPYQTPPASPQSVPQYLQRHMVRMFSTEVDNASGTSAVAIDNKIEQAMDLVKSHLMIAVREEVEVLKERISELMDKINKLELENSILKSNIPQETLQQLQLQLQLAAPPATPAIQAAPAVQSVVAPAAAGQAVQQQAAGAVAVTGVATSPASAVVPTSIPNGSAENGSSAVESAAVSVEQQVQQVTSAAAAAASVVTANGPMS